MTSVCPAGSRGRGSDVPGPRRPLAGPQCLVAMITDSHSRAPDTGPRLLPGLTAAPVRAFGLTCKPAQVPVPNEGPHAGRADLSPPLGCSPPRALLHLGPEGSLWNAFSTSSP